MTKSHEVIPSKLKKELTPVLVWPANTFLYNSPYPVVLKGIEPSQNILDLPTHVLKNVRFSAIIGTKMAEIANVNIGDYIKVQYFDTKGKSDTIEFKICYIFHTNVSEVDNGNIWIPIETLNQIIGTKNHATYFITNKDFNYLSDSIWIFKSQKELLKPINDIIQTKKGGASIV